MDSFWPTKASRLSLAGSSLLIRRSNLLKATLLTLLVVLIGFDSFSSANSKQLANGQRLHSTTSRRLLEKRASQDHNYNNNNNHSPHHAHHHHLHNNNNNHHHNNHISHDYLHRRQQQEQQTTTNLPSFKRMNFFGQQQQTDELSPSSISLFAQISSNDNKHFKALDASNNEINYRKLDDFEPLRNRHELKQQTNQLPSLKMHFFKSANELLPGSSSSRSSPHESLLANNNDNNNYNFREETTATTIEMDNNRIDLEEEKPSKSRQEPQQQRQQHQVPEQASIVVSSSDISYVSASPIQATTETSSAIIRPSANRNSFKQHISSSSSISSNYIESSSNGSSLRRSIDIGNSSLDDIISHGNISANFNYPNYSQSPISHLRRPHRLRRNHLRHKQQQQGRRRLQGSQAPSSNEIQSRYEIVESNNNNNNLLSSSSDISTTATTTQRNNKFHKLGQQNYVKLPADFEPIVIDDDEDENVAIAPVVVVDDDDDDGGDDEEDDKGEEDDDDDDEDLDDDVDDDYASELAVRWPWKLSASSSHQQVIRPGAQDLYNLLGEQGQAKDEIISVSDNSNNNGQASFSPINGIGGRSLSAPESSPSSVHPSLSEPIHYSKIVNGHHSLGSQRQWRDSHIASIRIGQDDQDDYGRGGLNSAIIAIMFGIGATGMLIVIVGHKMKSIRKRLAYKGHRRSLVPDAAYAKNLPPC